MDFADFEQLVLRVLFETDLPITPVHVAYVGGVPVKTAERYLARMAEQGTLLVRADANGDLEYVFPGKRAILPRPQGAADPSATAVSAEGAAPPGGGGPLSADGGLPLALAPRPQNTALTAVLLSMLVPGAGHIYAGRSGAGVAWMATTLVGYACWFLPGLFLHGLCLVSASQARQS
jgi:hypothetical protein